jgi:hypothetical protein
LLVWVIDPKSRTAEVFNDPARPERMTLVREVGVLDGGTVLAGFHLPLADLFGDLEPPARLHSDLSRISTFARYSQIAPGAATFDE